MNTPLDIHASSVSPRTLRVATERPTHSTTSGIPERKENGKSRRHALRRAAVVVECWLMCDRYFGSSDELWMMNWLQN